MNIEQEKKEPCAVSSITYNEIDDILYIGDERGCLNAYSFK